MAARAIFIAFVLSALSAAPGAAAGRPTPPAEVVKELRRHHHHHDWWRITTDSARFEARVSVIDEGGLAGLTAARGAPSVPERVAWGSIARIDLKKTHETRGKITGMLLGLCAGFIPLANGNANSSQPRNYLLVGGAAGYWLGGRVGAGNAHERPLYVAPTPLPSPLIVGPVAALPETTSVGAAAGQAVATSFDSSATDSAATSGAASAPAATAPASVTAPTVAATPAIARACRRITPESLLRIDGQFGTFCGYASTIGPAGLGGLRVEMTRRSVQSPGSLGWDRIHRIEVNGSNAGRGAAMGALGLGVATGLLAIPLAEVVVSSSGNESSGVAPIVLACAAVGAGVGLVIGAIVGALSSSWHLVYTR